MRPCASMKVADDGGGKNLDNRESVVIVIKDKRFNDTKTSWSNKRGIDSQTFITRTLEKLLLK